MKTKLKRNGRRASVWIALLAGVSFWALCPASASSGAAKDADAIAEGVQKKVNSTAEFMADFKQQTEIKTLGRTIQAAGKVYFKRPGRMLWRYEEPKGQYVLADGKHLFLYQPEQAQVIKTPLRNAFRSDVPLSFLLGIGDLKRDFKYELKGSENGAYLLRLIPRSELGQVGELILGVDMKEFELQWVRIEDAVGNVTNVRFSSMQRGLELKDALFQPNIPQGVEVVEFGALEGR